MYKGRNILVCIAILALSSMYLLGQDTWPPALDCVDFEEPALGSTYTVGTGFADSGAQVNGRDFQWSNGVWTSNGFMEIADAATSWCDAGGSGQHLLINNINAEILWPAQLPKGLTLGFGEYGGNVNININGDHVNVEDFALAPGVIGGVVVSCAGPGCTSGGTGVLTLDGPIDSFYIGGQEFCIDDVCPIP